MKRLWTCATTISAWVVWTTRIPEDQSLRVVIVEGESVGSAPLSKLGLDESVCNVGPQGERNGLVESGG